MRLKLGEKIFGLIAAFGGLAANTIDGITFTEPVFFDIIIKAP